MAEYAFALTACIWLVLFPSERRGPPMEPDITQFLTKGYTAMQVDPRIRPVIERIVPNFLRLIHDMDGKEALIRSWQCDHGKQNDPDTGLVFKTSAQAGFDGTHYDTKAYFHYRHYLWTILQLNKVKLKEYQHALLADCGELWDLAQAQALGFARALDAAKPGYWFERGLRSSHDSVIRLLCYLRERADEAGVIAQPHVDRNSITFALYENKPGFQMAKNPGVAGDWIPMGSSDGTALVFPGNRLDVLTDGAIQPSWHRVVGSNEPTGKEIRISVIFFANMYGVPYKQTHQTPLPFPDPTKKPRQ